MFKALLYAARRWLAGSAVAVSLFAPCVPAVAQDDPDDYFVEFGTLDRAGMKSLASVLYDVDSLLADGITSTAQLRPLADIAPDALYASAEGRLPGIFEVQRDINDASPHQVKFSVIFGSDADRNEFEALLTKRFGQPDDTCTIDGYGHWQLGEDRSARWIQLDYDAKHVEISVRASAPVDANCVPSASDSAYLLNPAQLTAFIERLRDEPVPFNDDEAFRSWLARYGALEETGASDCALNVTLPSYTSAATMIEGLNGFVFLLGQANICEQEEELSYLILSSQIETDMFAMNKFTAAAEAVLGPSIPGCSDQFQTVWRLNEDRSFVLAASYMSVSAYIYDRPVDYLGC